MRNLILALGVLGVLNWPLPALAQPGPSVDVAASLTAMMDAKGLRAFATADPGEPGRYVAAMYIPGAQLLVVSARYAVPVLMDTRLEQHQYEQAYMDLQSASVVASKWFVQDLQADGLAAERQPDKPFDIVYRHGARYVMLDSDWGGQGLTATEYRLRFEAAEKRYATMLRVLATALESET